MSIKVKETKTFRCDRCGDENECEGSFAYKQLEISNIVVCTGHVSKFLRLDLCITCYSAISRFINYTLDKVDKWKPKG